MGKIKHIEYCFGCGLCAASCPTDVISMVISEEGFYVPSIEKPEKCVKCLLCEKVCSYLNDGLASSPSDITGYVVSSKDHDVTQTCSSGGVGFEIARLLIQKGYKACGVKYSCSQNRAEHFIADNIDDFEQSKGSKYLQSYTPDAFKCFKSKDKYVVFGTPCQMDSLKRWIMTNKSADNFVLVDFFCHGVPSYHLWNNYLKYIKHLHGFSVINSVKFRDKSNGHGRNSWAMKFTSDHKSVVSSLLKDRDLFYKFFLGNECLNAACYDTCKFKYKNSSADIRIGDLWSKKYLDSGKPLSAVFANNDKARLIIDELRPVCDIKNEDVDVVAGGQMLHRLKMPKNRAMVINNLTKRRSLKFIYYYSAILKKTILKK